jgi:general L-amino acid transport system permease protein
MSIFQIKQARSAPSNSQGVQGWLMQNLFSSKLNIAFSLFAIYLLYLTIPPLLDWMLFSADFTAKTNDTCTRDAACWSYIGFKIDLFMYGIYPSEEYWRPNLLAFITIAFVIVTRFLKGKSFKNKVILTMFAVYPFIAFFLLYGNEILGINIVETHEWGGLMLTVIVASVGIIASFPIGIALALGRQSKMKTIKFFSVIYIEFIRGIPLITILFMASVMLPLFFMSDVDFDKLLRALIGITLFQSAYIAEIIRGGLQSVPKGQYEAADAAGLNFIQKMSLVILPQALKTSIPNIVGSFIALFKDTTLVLIIGIFDMLAIAELATSDTEWLGRKTEGIIFVAIVIWVILFLMSRYSKTLEKRFNTEH